MHPIIFDLLIVFVVLISTVLGRRRGFILTLCGFLALFVALIGAAVLTNLLAKPISLLALPFVENLLDQVIQPAAEGAVHATVDLKVDGKPAVVDLRTDGAHLGHHIRHKGLSAETRFNGHYQY